MPPDTAPGTALQHGGQLQRIPGPPAQSGPGGPGRQQPAAPGRTGTGKQRLAHGIHQASPRAAAPLITVRGHDGSEAELEAEFFGSDDGAGHVTAGALELANGGTLFLDEIEKFPTKLEDALADALRNGSGTGKPAPAGNTMCG